MKIIKIIPLIVAFVSTSFSFAFGQSVTLSFSLGNLYTGTTTSSSLWSSGSGIINVLVLTNGQTWAQQGNLNNLFSQLTNSFTPTGAVRASFGSATDPGAYGGAPNINLANGLASGQEFIVVGFSSLNTLSAQPGLGTSGFFYRESSWVLPAGGATVDFFAETDGYGGDLPEATFTSGSGAVGGNGFTTVPEPSTYALLAMGGLALGGYMIRRRRRA